MKTDQPRAWQYACAHLQHCSQGERLPLRSSARWGRFRLFEPAGTPVERMPRRCQGSSLALLKGASARFARSWRPRPARATRAATARRGAAPSITEQGARRLSPMG
eukprot:9151915-Pyramimonas_sp.AAC.1